MNEEILAPVSDEPKTGVTMNILKYIAIVAMFIDHATNAFVPNDTVLYIVLRFIGRITGPVMFFAAAEGYQHTRNINKYMIRLAAFALISYLPFIYYVSGGVFAGMDFRRLNVIYTIFLGVTAIRVRREMKNRVVKAILILCLILLSIPGDWGVTGIIVMLLFDYFYGNFKYQAYGYCAIVLLYVGVLKLVTQPVTQLILYHSISIDMSAYKYLIINTGMFIPILLLKFYNSQKGSGGKFAKWFFYVFYPLHLLILGILQKAL